MARPNRLRAGPNHESPRQLGFDAAMTPTGRIPQRCGSFRTTPGLTSLISAAVDHLGREARGVPVAYGGSKATRLVGTEASSVCRGMTMRDRFGHLVHVFRVGVVLGVGLVAFLIARAAAIPSDFGVLGFYRAGALDDNRARPIVHAGRTACLECHDSTYDPPEPAREASGRRSPPPCSSIPPRTTSTPGCIARPATDLSRSTSQTRTSKCGAEGRLRGLCLNCHRKVTGRPRSQPQMVPAVHTKSRTHERRVRRLPQASLAEDDRRRRGQTD